jgi:23S rRNA (adenine2503-C2)-methyltransferase
MEKINLKDLTLDELTTVITGLGFSGFRAKQIFAWLYRPDINSFEQMTDLSISVREKLAGIAAITGCNMPKREQSKDGTVKYGFTLADKLIIESVLIPDGERNTLCVSSQAGCAMGCRFCLTGTMGLKRNLSPSEIVGQVKHVQDELLAKKCKVNNIVFMGMGEPLANFDNLIKAINILLEQRGLNFSERKITVSTCGLVPKINELGDETNVNLAISLHAATDEIRSSLMPVNETYPLSELLNACHLYPLSKRKRIMFEYVMLAGINDSDDDAVKLAKILRGIPCKINLLPYNECTALPYQKPTKARVDKFQDILANSNYTVLVRESRGEDISAACGQLASKL